MPTGSHFPHLVLSGPAGARIVVLVVDDELDWARVLGWKWRGKRLCLRLPQGWKGWVMPAMWRAQWDEAQEHWGAAADDEHGLREAVRLLPYPKTPQVGVDGEKLRKRTRIKES
jgi:hypothetical protein